MSENVSHELLHQELTMDPDHLGYAPLLAAGSDTDLLMLLTTAQYEAYQPVTMDRVLIWAAQQSRWTKLVGASTNMTDIPGVGDVASLAHIGLILIQSPVVANLDITDPTIEGMFDALVAVGVFTPEDKDALWALGATHISRAQVLWGRQVVVFLEDVAAARQFGTLPTVEGV